MLDSVVTTVDVYDLIIIKKRKKDKLVSVCMHGMGSEGIAFDDNNAVKAAEAFIRTFDTCGVNIEIYKNIPMGAGLGGSSADAAGVLNGLKKLFNVSDEEKIKKIADLVGSDCGYMLYGGYARISGRGDRVELINGNLKLDILLLLPSSPVSTVECYKTYDKLNCRQTPSSGEAYSAVKNGDKVALGKSLKNSLFPSAAYLNGEVAAAAQALRDFDPLGASMTGSGSCVFALFENEQYCRYALSRYNGKCRAVVTKTHLPKRGN